MHKDFEARVWAMYLQMAPLGAPIPDVSEEQERSARRALFWQSVKLVETFEEEIEKCRSTTARQHRS